MEFELSPRQIGGGKVSRTAGGWRLEMPAGASRTYRLAQLDDYARTRRSQLPYRPPWKLRLRARVSQADLPGTWGFGLWNDPFGLSLGFGGKPARLPALPQTAWFFHASPPNWLSLSKGLPGDGFFAGMLASPGIPSLLLAPALVAVPLCAIRPISRFFRRLTGDLIRQAGAGISVDGTQWHDYSIAWQDSGCSFHVDGIEILSTPISPRPPLGLVIWIDNQFAAWTPQGQFGYGTLTNPVAWLEIENPAVEQ
jgi:hypothetical protein